MRFNPCRSALAAFALLSASAASAAEQGQEMETRPELGLMGTLPLYWGEAEALGDLLEPGRDRHWARDLLERDYRLLPLDWLAADALAPLRRLLLAQPRALSPEENVALDDWVRGGGQLLLFADPMLTGESRFAPGDRRRPQDVVLLSPILGHWGLRLEYVEDQPAGPRQVELADGAIPVRLAGRLSPHGTMRECAIGAEGILARCRIGAGTALIVADAALLDLHHPGPDAAPALALLLARAFPPAGDNAGNQGGSVKSDNYQYDEPSFEGWAPPEKAPETG